MIALEGVEKWRERERESLDLARWKRGLVAIQEDQAGELGLQRLHLKYYEEEGFEAPHESQTLVLLS